MMKKASAQDLMDTNSRVNDWQNKRMVNMVVARTSEGDMPVRRA